MMITLEDLRPLVLKKPEALTGYEDEKNALAREMSDFGQRETKSEKEEAKSEKKEAHILA